jgi:hypothetical protein
LRLRPMNGALLLLLLHLLLPLYVLDCNSITKLLPHATTACNPHMVLSQHDIRGHDAPDDLTKKVLGTVGSRETS